MLRMILTEDLWTKLKSAMVEIGFYNKPNLRMIIEGILWRLRPRSPWRDLPDAFGPWSSVYNQFNRWSKRGLWPFLADKIASKVIPILMSIFIV